jgi:hypothetical protein
VDAVSGKKLDVELEELEEQVEVNVQDEVQDEGV